MFNKHSNNVAIQVETASKAAIFVVRHEFHVEVKVNQTVNT